MNAKHVPSLRRRLSVAAVGVLLVASATACAEAELAVGEATVGALEGSTPSATTDPAGDATGDAAAAPSTTPPIVVDAALESVRTDVGSFSVQFPLGWEPMAGIAAVASGDASTAAGAATYSSVPAVGKDQTAWVAEMMAGGGVTGVDGNLSLFPAIAAADGREIFHLGQDYADNRAHLYGYVEGDVLHLLRFGLDGTEATVDVINRAVATTVHVTPAVPATPPATPAAPATTVPPASPATPVAPVAPVSPAATS